MMIEKQPVKRIESADADALCAQLGAPHMEICDYSVGNIFMWKDLLDTERIGDGALCLAEHYKGEAYFSLRAADGAYIARIEALLAQFSAPLHLCSMTDAEVALLQAHYGDRFTYTGEDGAADYIYDAEALRAFAGRKYHAQKNHVNAFLRSYPDYDFVKCDEPEELLAMLDRYEAAAGDTSESARQESLACRRLLAALPLPALDARVLRIGGETVGFCILEQVGDTLMVHVEKALTAYRGVYPMLVHLEACAYPDVLYVNREEDDANEGLRRAKRSYHPLRLLQKYIGKIE